MSANILRNNRKRILVIDDEPSVRKAIRMSLQTRNYSVDVTADGPEGVEMNRRDPFDLAILDLVLKNDDGLEILRTLRKDAPDLLAIIITGSGSLKSSIEAIELEVSAYIEKPLHIKSILTAVSKAFRKRAETEEMIREQVKALLERSREDKSIDRTASYYIHRVNDPLTNIRGYAELAMMSTDNPEFLQEYLTRIIESSEKIDSINQAFFRTGPNLHGSIEYIDPVAILGHCIKEFEAIFRLKGIALNKKTADSKVAISGNRFELEQIFKNLIANAVDALEGYAEKSILVETEVPDPRHRVLFHIRDTGCGIPKEIMETIFQPRFTTKPNRKGIGLYIARELAGRLDGDILVESVVGKGTKFTLGLPVPNSTGRK